ncbi:endonuclease V [Trichechus manatus latirostris]|uniref:Endonuclease V n=1 Tax=Trichechus manatus latirostris TaxID=127582 RepID=A0A2Y9FVW3_TRIMA|nr:endonuclease V [Trichechus manatus latirostris]
MALLRKYVKFPTSSHVHCCANGKPLHITAQNWDTEAWQRDPDFSGLQRVGGVDVSFVKGDSVNACASLVVLSYPELEVVYEECRMVNLLAPYVSGFLAFREVPFLAEAVRQLQEKEPSLLPQVLLVDGNGLLHHRGFGVACHLGVLTDLPCIGVAKKLLQVDGLEKNNLHKEKIQLLQAGGDTFPLVGDSGIVLGMALKSHDRSTNPLYVSVGHKISLEAAVRLTRACCRFRIPEPVRQADIRSREYIRRTLGLPVPPAPRIQKAKTPEACPQGGPGKPAGEGKPPEDRSPGPGADLDAPTQASRDSGAWAGGRAELDAMKTQGSPTLASRSMTGPGGTHLGSCGELQPHSSSMGSVPGDQTFSPQPPAHPPGCCRQPAVASRFQCVLQAPPRVPASWPLVLSGTPLTSLTHLGVCSPPSRP